MDFSCKVYLANAERRLANLRRIVNNRPVGILAGGPSIRELEKTVNGLPDICWMGVNEFIQEKYILEPVGRRLSIFYDSCKESIPLVWDSIQEFLARDDDNLFVSSFDRDAYTEDVLKTLPDKKLFFISTTDRGAYPNEQFPLHFISGNSIQQAIPVAIIGGASKVILFGVDGGYKPGAFEKYYRQDEYGLKDTDGEALAGDAEWFCKAIPYTLLNTYNLYDIPPIKILNCSPDSEIKIFPKISYKELRLNI